MIYLDELTPSDKRLYWGGLGLHGQLGYEGRYVTLPGGGGGRSVSAHGPSSITYNLGRRYDYFHCHAAISGTGSDSVFGDFRVYADGRLACCAPRVMKGQRPFPLECRINGAHEIELVVDVNTGAGAHSVWVDPFVSAGMPDTLRSNLGFTRVTVPPTPIRADSCVATTVTPGYERYLYGFLKSLRRFGNIGNAAVVVFSAETTPLAREIADEFGATIVEVEIVHRGGYINAKNALYAIASVADADQYLCFDVDMLVLGDVSPLLSAGAMPDDTVLISPQHFQTASYTLRDAISGDRSCYCGAERDLDFLRITERERQQCTVVNGGVFGGGKAAMLAVDAHMRGFFPQSSAWVDEIDWCYWREEFMFSAAVARMGTYVFLHPSYNIQMYAAPISTEGGVITSGGKPVKCLHFVSTAKEQWEELSRVAFGDTEDGFLAHEAKHLAGEEEQKSTEPDASSADLGAGASDGEAPQTARTGENDGD